MSNSIKQTINNATQWGWKIDPSSVSYDESAIKQALLQLNSPCYLVNNNGEIGLSQTAVAADQGGEGFLNVIAYTAPFTSDNFGDQRFSKAHGSKHAYHGGAMANGIASEELVIALGKAGYLCSFGAAGLVKSRVEQAIQRIQAELPDGPYAVNLIHSPSEPALEQANVDLFLQYKIRTVEASAFLKLTPQIVQYRVAGLSKNTDGSINIANRVIAKISRTEVATKFMEPAPQKMLDALVEKGLITAEQAELATQVPMADDITAEADSGGHTDNRPFITLLPTILTLREEIQDKYNYDPPLRVGVGGGIGTPTAVLAAFVMGAAYVVTGSVNQACYQAEASEHTRRLLSEAQTTDVIMAPAADMFEMGVKLQVIKRGTLFAMRAQKLYELYSNYDSIEAIPLEDRKKIEKQIFRRNLDEVWTETTTFFNERDPAQIERANGNPKRKMALIFRWYLGLSSRWSNIGEEGREMDYQIWAGPSLGAFNAWVKGTDLEDYKKRDAVEVADHLLAGAAFLYRLQNLKGQGFEFSSAISHYVPSSPVER
ncbi:MAG: PfaD family polyunsaturated fatty acid/polyketide biosynthesis protein [Pseudomonadales bacterium]|nr:PfaD family polyunsaturated fatty acid/polyketide biosynthesis protein [Pseudomonadales bacterium]